MGRYFGREPRYTREELERQAQDAIDARVSMGRPPEEDFLPLEARLAEADLELVSRPLVQPPPEPEPLQIREVRQPPTAASAAEPPAEPVPAEAAKQPVAARTSSN